MSAPQVQGRTAAWVNFEENDAPARRQAPVDAERNKTVTPPAAIRQRFRLLPERCVNGRKVASVSLFDPVNGEQHFLDGGEGNFADSEVLKDEVDWEDQADDRPSSARPGVFLSVGRGPVGGDAVDGGGRGVHGRRHGVCRS